MAWDWLVRSVAAAIIADVVPWVLRHWLGGTGGNRGHAGGRRVSLVSVG